MITLGGEAAWPIFKRSLITIYNDVYDEHLFVFAAGLSYYFVLSLFPLLVSMASLLAYVPVPHLFEGLLTLMARLVPGDGMSLVRNIVSDVINHKHPHFLTLGLVFTIWTVSSGFVAIIDGLNVVYRVRETRPVWKTRPIALGLTLLAGSLVLDRSSPELREWVRLNKDDRYVPPQRDWTSNERLARIVRWNQRPSGRTTARKKLTEEQLLFGLLPGCHH